MHQDALAAAISFFALGANLLGTMLLLLFNPRDREVRWFSAFQLAIVVWLLAQGMAFFTGNWRVWGYPHSVAISFLPALFLAAGLAEKRDPPWKSWAAASLGLVFAPIMLLNVRGDFWLWSALTMSWQVIGWSAGSIYISKRSLAQRPQHHGPWTPERLMLLALLLAAPASIVIALLVGADQFFIYAMPVVTVAIQVLIFIGVARMRFYDIEVRVARSGDLAGRAAEHERLAVLGELAATIAHEVRNPLTGMRSLTQRIAEDDVTPDKRRRYAEVILEEVGRLERIVGNLLGTAHKSVRQTWNGQRTDLQPLFEDLQLLVQSRARDANVRVAFDAARLDAAAPREALAQALLNLLLNAIRHAPAGTTVELCAAADGDATEIIVRDQGAGVPLDEREQIFQPFHSGSNGTGLGLSVVRALARELGWDVRVTSAADGGAEFVVRVPNAPAAATVA